MTINCITGGHAGNISDYTPLVTTSNGKDVMPTLDTTQFGKHNGSNQMVDGGGMSLSIGNGQAAEMESALVECCQTLNCMHEVQKIAVVKDEKK